MQPDVKSLALGVILGVLVVLVLNNHPGNLIKDAVANTAPPAPMFLTEAAALNPNWYMDAWNIGYIVQEAMAAVLERCSVFVTRNTDDNQIFCKHAGR
jgi:hypothetical protein